MSITPEGAPSRPAYIRDSDGLYYAIGGGGSGGGGGGSGGVAPTAAFSITGRHLDVLVDASASDDPDGYVTLYHWNWGDGATESHATPTAEHTYATGGTRTITLTITDNRGDGDQVSDTFDAVAMTQTVSFVVNGATFNPTIELHAGQTSLIDWMNSDDQIIAAGVNPTMDFGSAATRTIRMFAVNPAAVRTLNLGFTQSDDLGRLSIGAEYNKPPEPVIGISGLPTLTGLVNFCAANGDLTGHLDFTGLSDLQFIECFWSEVQSVDLTGCTSLIRLCLEATALNAPLDLNPVRNNLYDLRAAYQRPGTLTFAPLAGPMTNLYHYCVRDQVVLGHFSAEQFLVLEELWDWNTEQYGQVPISAKMTSLAIFSNKWSELDTTGINYGTGGDLLISNSPLVRVSLDPNGRRFNFVEFVNCQMDSELVDYIINAVNAWDFSGISLFLAGNAPPTSASSAALATLIGRGWNVTVATVSDGVAPGPVTGLTAGTRTDTTIDLTWANPADGDLAAIVVRYLPGSTAPTTPYEGEPVSFFPRTSNWITVPSLSSGSPYAFAVWARDTSGNHSTRMTVTSSTTGTPDVTAPGPVTGLTVGTPTLSTIPLTWTNPVAADLTEIVVRMSAGTTPPSSPTSGVGVTVNPIKGTAATAIGLAADSPYAFSVYAADSTGNISTVSTATSSTVAPPATIPVTSGLIWHLRANSLALADGTPVASWTALTGPSPSSGTTGEQPLFYGSGGSHNGPYLSFDGNDRLWLPGTNFDELAAVTILVRYYNTKNNGYPSCLFGRTGSPPTGVPQLNINADGVGMVFLSSGEQSYGSPVATSRNAWHTVAVRYTAVGILSFGHDNVLHGPQSAAPRMWQGGMNIGFNEHEHDYAFVGNISHFVRYNRALTDTELRTVMEWMGAV